jgi:hypothetical protein
MIARIKLKGDEPPAPSAAPSASPILEVYCGRPTHELIPYSEFPIGMRDHATDNCRRSLTESKPRPPQDEMAVEIVVSEDMLLAELDRRKHENNQ